MDLISYCQACGEYGHKACCGLEYLDIKADCSLIKDQLAATKEKLARADRALTMIANNPFCQDTCKGVAEIAIKAYREVGSD